MSKTTRKRARNTKGQYVGDDPTTLKDEAWVSGPKYLWIGDEISKKLSQRIARVQQKVWDPSNKA